MAALKSDMDKLEQSGEEEAGQRDLRGKGLDDSPIYCVPTKCQALQTALGGRDLRLRITYSDMVRMLRVHLWVAPGLKAV